jgi:hypothetical protein
VFCTLKDFDVVVSPQGLVDNPATASMATGFPTRQFWLN